MQEGRDEIAVPPLLRFSALVVEAMADDRAEIDALNVYPVPDGDTGTNLFLTFQSAHEALTRAAGAGPDLDTAVSVYCRGLLLGARGNSGVIMSQLVGALLRRLVGAAPDESASEAFARGMTAATEAAYAAVGEPVEGTMLTVARAASDEATRVVDDDPAVPVDRVLAAASRAAREALARTPEQLPVLRDAGVVDAGGSGLCVVLEAAESAYTGRRRPAPAARRWATVPEAAVPADDLTEDGPAYEVMYLLDADDDRIPPLREALQPLGDSLVVVGGEGLWNVHVHVDDVGAAVEAGIAAGRPHRIRVTHFAEQVLRLRHQAAARAAHAPGERRGRRVVTVAFGPGLTAMLVEAGAEVLEATVDRRPSTGELLEAIVGTHAAEVIVVPNDRDVVPAAEAAARLAEDDHAVRVAVIPTSAQVQGIAALAVHEPSRPFEEDLVEMAAAARHARSGAVTVAARRAITTAGVCEPGDVLGAVEGDFVVVGDDLGVVAVDVVERLLGGGGELVTVIPGADGEDLAQRCLDHLAVAHPTVEVLVYDGGQARYPLLLGVE